MRISKLRIQNFRSFDDEEIHFDEYNCFVGPNGAGKSTVLTALNILFRYDEGPGSVTTLAREDFHLKQTRRPVQISATFTDIEPEAAQELSAYVRQDQLVIKAVAEWDEVSQSASVEQKGVRLVMRDFAPYFEADESGASAADLKGIFRDLRKEYPELPDVYVKAEMRGALREYEENHSEKCELVDSGDQFYGWSRGQNKLKKYLQWVYIPAVKDATEEQEEGRNTALGELLGRSIRQKVDFSDSLEELKQDVAERYQGLLAKQNSLLEGLATSIQTRLREWAHSGANVELRWRYDPDKSVSVQDPNATIRVGEGEFLGEVMRVGHGMQRSFLVALLQELASNTEDAEHEPTLILAIEEPELYQHPPQARHLAGVFETLAASNSQVLLTSHSPYFISAEGVPSVRMTRRQTGNGGTRVTGVTLEEVSERLAAALEKEPQKPTALMSKIHQIMRPAQREIFFARVPVLMEGPEDIAFISSHLHLAGYWDDFRRLGCHLVACGGKGAMSRPLAVALSFDVPAFVVFDADIDQEKDGQPEKHRRDNSCLLRLLGYDDVDPLPTATVWKPQAVVWPHRIASTVEEDVGAEPWEEARERARGRTDEEVGDKDALLVTAAMEELHEASNLPQSLTKLTETLLRHAEGLQRGEQTL